MVVVDLPQNALLAVALPGTARALVLAGKLEQKKAEDIFRKSQSGKNSFIAELINSGVISAADLAHTMSVAFASPLIDLDAVDPQRLPKGLLDAKLCQSLRVVVLAKRNNRLIVATADPSDQTTAEKIKFATQSGADWVIAEYDKLTKLVDAASVSTSEALDSIVGAPGDFEFDEATMEAVVEEQDDAATDVEDAPIVKFLQKMLLDAYGMRASDLHFEPYEHTYRVRFRIDGELREIASPPISIKDKLRKSAFRKTVA
jgi:type IV pilus assembly protein PilB